ncbi:hypothetical protein LCGC14_1888610, partial [marine sediment metagenome]
EQELSKILDKSAIKKLGIESKNIEFLFIDYVVPSKQKLMVSVFGKLNKYYQAQDRLLFIVFYGRYSNDIFEMVNTQFAKMNPDHKENIRFIDLLDFVSILNINDKFLLKFEELNELIKLAFHDDALNKLEIDSSEAMYNLELYRQRLLRRL